MNASNSEQGSASHLTEAVKKVAQDISDVAVPPGLCRSPRDIVKDIKSPTNSDVAKRKKGLLIGHRGAKNMVEENTMRSFYTAIDTKCDVVEFDVIISSGNKLVCKHDFVNLETGEWLCDYDAATFRRNNPDNPYLEEVLQDSKIRESGVDLIIDVKQRGIIHRLLFFLSEAIRDYGWSADRIAITSHLASVLLEFTVMKRGFPELHPIRLIAVLGNVPPTLAEEYEQIGCCAVSLSVGAFSQELIDDIHLRGMHVYMFSVNSLGLARALLKKGVDGIITDSPHVVGEAVREHNRQTILGGVQVPRFQPDGVSNSLLNFLYTNANKVRVNELLVEAQKLLGMLEKAEEDGSCKRENDIHNLRATMLALEPFAAMKPQT